LPIVSNAKYQNLLSEIQEQRQIIDELKKINMELQNALSESIRNYEKCLSDKVEIEKQLTQFKQELNETIGEYDKYQGRYIVACSDVKELDREIQRIRTELIHLKAEVKDETTRKPQTLLKEPNKQDESENSTFSVDLLKNSAIYDVDKLMNKLKSVYVNIDTENIIVESREPKPPLKKKYELTDDVVNGNYIAFDLETTGLSPARDEIIELSAVRFRSFVPVSAFSTVVNPLKDVPRTVLNLTGIEPEEIQDSPLLCHVLNQFTEFVGQDAMVGHNIRAFDLKFLYKVGFDMDTIERSYYDTLSLARKRIAENEVKDYKLETLLEYFGITRSSAHRGLTDSVAEGLLFAKLINL